MPNRPIIGDGFILLTAWSKQSTEKSLSLLYAVDPESGKAKWVTRVDDSWDITAPVTARGLAFFAVRPSLSAHSDRETLYAVDAANGRVAWTVGAERWSGTPQLLIADDTIYFRAGKSLLALALDTGREVWSLGLMRSGKNSDDLFADAQQLYVLTEERSLLGSHTTLHALALDTGQERWSRQLDSAAGTAPRIAMIQDGVVYAEGKVLIAIEASTGRELWSFKGSGRESARLISGGRIFLTSPTETYSGTDRVDQGYLSAIDAKTGKP